MKKTLTCSALFAFTIGTSSAQFSNTNLFDNIFPADYHFQRFTPTYQPKTLFGRFANEFTRSDQFINRIGSPSAFDLARAYQREHIYLSTYTDIGQHAFERAASDAAREAALSYFPVDSYRSTAEQIGLWFIHGALGNTAEERRAILSPVPNASEFSWWQQARNDGVLGGGIRPFNTSPYIYGWFRFGHMSGGQPLGVLSCRWYYNIPKNEDHITIDTTIALSHAYELHVGASVDPFHTSDRDQSSFSGRIQHVTKSDNSFLFHSWSIGGSVSQNEKLLIAQVAWTW